MSIFMERIAFLGGAEFVALYVQILSHTAPCAASEEAGVAARETMGVAVALRAAGGEEKK